MRSLILALSLCLLISCREAGNGNLSHPLGQQLTQQVISSCELGMAYHKTVTDQQTAEVEDSVFAPIPLVDFGSNADGEDSLNYLLLRDLAYAVERLYDDPYLQEVMTRREAQDTLIAEVLPKQAKSMDLQHQKVLYAPDGQHLIYLETSLNKRSWLYAMQVDIAVQFDSLSRYQSHRLVISTKVPLLGQTFSARIDGKGQYPDS